MLVIFRALPVVTVCLGLAACAGSAPVPDAPAGGGTARSSHSSGIAYRDRAVYVAKDALPRVNVAGDPRLGSATARIGIVEFSDYQCVYCRDFHQRQFPRLKQEFIDTGVVQFIHKDLPLPRHAQSVRAAMSAHCAGAQGRFWGMHDALYTDQARLGPGLYAELARRLGLDMTEFDACVDGKVHARDIQRDMQAARLLGLTATPSFLIGTIEGDTLTVVRQSRGAPDFELFAQEIEKLR